MIGATSLPYAVTAKEAELPCNDLCRAWLGLSLPGGEAHPDPASEPVRRRKVVVRAPGLHQSQVAVEPATQAQRHRIRLPTDGQPDRDVLPSLDPPRLRQTTHRRETAPPAGTAHGGAAMREADGVGTPAAGRRAAPPQSPPIALSAKPPVRPEPARIKVVPAGEGASGIAQKKSADPTKRPAGPDDSVRARPSRVLANVTPVPAGVPPRPAPPPQVPATPPAVPVAAASPGPAAAAGSADTAPVQVRPSSVAPDPSRETASVPVVSPSPPAGPSRDAADADPEPDILPTTKRDGRFEDTRPLDGSSRSPAVSAPDVPPKVEDIAAARPPARPLESGLPDIAETPGRAGDPQVTPAPASPAAMPANELGLSDDAVAARAPDPSADGSGSLFVDSREFAAAAAAAGPATGAAPASERLAESDVMASHDAPVEPVPTPALSVQSSTSSSEDVTVYLIGFLVLALSGYLMLSLTRSRFLGR